MHYSKRLGATLVLCAVAAIVAGCATTYPVVGSFDDHNEVMVGTVHSDLMKGSSLIEVQGQNSKIRCRGTSRVLHIPASNYIAGAFLIPYCRGQRGDARLKCDDGRIIDAAWEAEDCAKGSGYGADQNGNRFTFAFGMTREEAQTALDARAQQVAAKPALPNYRPKETRKEQGFSTGTGFFVSSSGHLVTNYHVIEDAKHVYVMTKGVKTPALILRADSSTDVALLKVDVITQALPLSTAAEARKGDEVFTLGFPLVSLQGQELKASFGRINAVTGIKDDFRFLQTDTPVQPGNSGGPLIDAHGRVIGIITATLDALTALRSSGSLPQNVNYAVKADYLLPLLSGVALQKPMSLQSRPMRDLVANSEDAVVLVVAE